MDYLTNKIDVLIEYLLDLPRASRFRDGVLLQLEILTLIRQSIEEAD